MLNWNWNRHYDPSTGRYVQPDPTGFADGPSVYAYAKSSPQVWIDPQGSVVNDPRTPKEQQLSNTLGENTDQQDIEDGRPVDPMKLPPPGIPGGPWGPAPGQLPGDFYGPKQPSGPQPFCRYVPPEGQGGPPGSIGYWKTLIGPGKWQRWDSEANPITPEQAHP
ncbi:RHS repeat-associated core domain-containing protein [Methylocapsa sp. S129]|uniref:RHS repeat-associated core domain-containing protein n=1 Tax=Methylocapsa sp. S129 TaxID=1641869 RepID=UPI00131AA5A2